MKPTRIMLALAATLAPAVLSAQSNEDVHKQIEGLKQQIQALEEKTDAAKAVDARLTKVETKIAGDNIQWGGDLRTRFDTALASVSDLKALQALRDEFLGRKGGAVAALMKAVAAAPTGLSSAKCRRAS